MHTQARNHPVPLPFDLAELVRTTLDGATGDAMFANQDDAILEIQRSIAERGERALTTQEGTRVMREVVIQWNARELSAKHALLIVNGTECASCRERFATGDVILDSMDKASGVWVEIHRHQACEEAHMRQKLAVLAKSGTRGLRMALR